ncbi:dynein regulatory complex subunit 3-like [Dysidea avara]|uniref:dynein regulatory complex subunit 3-like n=1 Tax=Dysidea avara TaxID=196820 RepID=UPI003323D487
MSRLYDTIEPSVIDEALLHQCIEEQGPDGEAGRIAKSEGIDFKEVLELRLSYKNILRMENLWCVENLTKLQLDNNIIERIEGLEALTNLVWLDLSFNNIEMIEGLSSLVRLKDLSLAHNHIKVLDKMDDLPLEVLSIGNNLIEDLDQLSYLRTFSMLKAVTLSGNPVASHANYQPFLLAHLPALVYFDYRLVSDEARKAAQEQFQDLIEGLELQERSAERKAAEQEALRQKEELRKAAYVDGLEGNSLFEVLFKEDTEAPRLQHLSGVEEMLQQYQEKFAAICEDLRVSGLKEKELWDKERDAIFTSHSQAKTYNQQEAVALIQQYEDTKQQLILAGDMEKAIAQLNPVVDGLKHNLMKLEMTLVEQLDEINKEFERNYTEMVTVFIENVQNHMTQCRDIENSHHEHLSDIALQMLEKFVKNQLLEDLHDELRILFVDKDTLMNAINTSHDLHLLKIDEKEDKMLSQMRTHLKQLVDQMAQDELQRNRSRIMEINHYIDHQREELENLDDQ